MYPQILAGAVTAASQVAIRRWYGANPREPLRPLIERALRQLAAATAGDRPAGQACADTGQARLGRGDQLRLAPFSGDSSRALITIMHRHRPGSAATTPSSPSITRGTPPRFYPGIPAQVARLILDHTGHPGNTGARP